MAPTRSALLAALGLAALLGASAGCAHYRTGTATAPPFATIDVEVPANHTTLTQAQALVGAQVRQALLRDGRVQVVDGAAGADATLEITLSDYHREVAASRQDDTGLARKFALSLTVTCTLKDNRSGRVLFANRPVTATDEAFADNGLGSTPFAVSNAQLQSEYNALPQLGAGLGDLVAHAVLDVW